MSQVLAHIIRFAIAMAGYAFAVIISVLVAAFLMVLPTVLPDNDAWGSFYRSLQDLPLIIIYGLYLTAIFAFPGFVITLVLAIMLRWRHWLPFTIIEGLDAVFALGLLGSYNDNSINNLPGSLLVPCVVGSLAGGFVYWMTSGRFLARSRAVEAT